MYFYEDEEEDDDELVDDTGETGGGETVDDPEKTGTGGTDDEDSLGDILKQKLKEGKDQAFGNGGNPPATDNPTENPPGENPPSTDNPPGKDNPTKANNPSQENGGSQPLDRDSVKKDLEDRANKDKPGENGGNKEGKKGSQEGEPKPNNQGENAQKNKPSQNEGKKPEGKKPEGKKPEGKKPEGKKPEGGGASKADMAKNIAKGAQEGGAGGAAKAAGKEAGKEAAKKVIRQIITKIPPMVLFWAAVIILALIIIIGFIFFIISMPGMVSAKLKDMAMDLLKAYQAVQEGAEKQIDSSEIAKVANYLENMGYDLKGEGFITASTQYGDNGGLKHTESNVTYDEVQDVWRDETNKIIDLGSEPIFVYLVSDKLCYLIKNFNQNLETATGGNSTAQNIINGIITVVAVVAAVVVCILCPWGFLLSVAVGLATGAAVMGASYMAFAAVGNPNWGTGLISIYHEGSSLGKVGDYYSGWETGYISLDPDTKTLSIARGWSNDAYTYSVDGWSGRYGTPLEFLLSVHVATKMPDLAMEIATTFDTDVQVLLHSVDNGEIIAGYKIAEGQYVEYGQIDPIAKEDNNFFKNVWNGAVKIGSWFGWWNSDDHEAHTINPRIVKKLSEELQVPHSADCTCCSHIPLSRASKNSATNIAIYSGNHKIDNCEDCKTEEHSEECANGDSSQCTDCITVNHTETCNGKDANYKNSDNFSKKAQDGAKHFVCDACINQMTKMVTALKKMNDSNWESYTPYISKVTNHWFRDVYMVIENAANTEVVKTDEEYLLETNERWTMYETYTEEDSTAGNIPEGFVVGDHKLYEYNNGTYTLSTRTKEEVEELNEKIANGDTTVSKLVKKSLTEKVNGGSGRWTAYEIAYGANWSDWTQLDVNTERAAEMSEALTDPAVKDNLYYKENRPNDIIQKEDGQRGVTNEKIKNMFINKSYYKYDGSVERANAIYEDKLKHTENVDMNDEEQVKALSAKYNTNNDPRDPELISKVSLAKDSLTAFSMLQNTKTLDADYIYRDFKELIVELDYFDKEDLSDKAETVMQWMLPETGASGWPIRKYEKGEAFYGTLINSETDLRLLTDEDIKAAERIIAGLGNEVNTPQENETQTNSTTAKSVPAITLSQFIDTGYSVHKIMEDDGNWDYCVYEDHIKANCPAKDNGYNCGRAQHCDSADTTHVCGLSTTIQDAVNGYHNTCCATFVSWVLKEAGFDLSSHPNMHGAQAMYDWCVSQGWQAITDYSQMEAGDILFNNGTGVKDIGHTQLLGYENEWLNGGGISAINNEPYEDDLSNNFIIGMRSPLNSAKPFVGYKSGEVVVSPVTGKVIEHGTVNRQNEETGLYEDVEFIKIEVIHEYLYDVESPKGEAFRDCTTKDDVFENKVTNTDRRNREGYDYFYDEYQGIIDGFVLYIEGIDLTLFDEDGAIALVKKGETDTERVTRYEPNPTIDLLDDLREAQTIWQEDAKTFAIPVLQVGEDIYIKEGTVIGKTMSDEGRITTKQTVKNPDGTTTETMGGNGNYIRLILRDYEDSIIEDVETYFNIKKSETNLTPQPYEQEDEDLELLAKFLHKHGCQKTLEGKSGIKGKAQDVSRAIGYTVLNRAIKNYGNYGVTLKQQIEAPNQYSGGLSDHCEACVKNAEWCLTYDCNSVYSEMTEDAMNAVDRPNKTTNVPMTRDIISFYGTCKCPEPDTCWWWVDLNGNKAYDKGSSNNDIFFCVQ